MGEAHQGHSELMDGTAGVASRAPDQGTPVSPGWDPIADRESAEEFE